MWVARVGVRGVLGACALSIGSPSVACLRAGTSAWVQGASRESSSAARAVVAAQLKTHADQRARASAKVPERGGGKVPARRGTKTATLRASQKFRGGASKASIRRLEKDAARVRAAPRGAGAEAEPVKSRVVPRRPKGEAHQKHVGSWGPQFLRASLRGDIKTMKVLVKKGGQKLSVNKKNSRGGTPMHQAMRSKNTRALKVLLGIPRVDVNAQDKARDSPLLVGARLGRSEHVALLVAHMTGGGARLREKDRKGQSALALAAARGYVDVVRNLIKSGRDVADSPNDKGLTALHLAARRGHRNVVEVLVGGGVKGVEINRRCPRGQTALMMACREGHAGVVNALLSADGCDVNLCSEWRDSPLMAAARRGHADAVAALLRNASVDVNGPTTRRKNTALMLAVLGGHRRVVELMLQDPRVDLAPSNNDGRTSHELAKLRVDQGTGGERAKQVLHIFESRFQAEADAAARAVAERKLQEREASVRWRGIRVRSDRARELRTR